VSITEDTSPSPACRARGGRPCRAEAERRDERLIDVAAELFLAQGFAATSIESVARAAGVAKRTLYSRYPDKAALFAAVVRRLIDHWHQSLDDLGPPDADLATRLDALARVIMTASTSPQSIALHRIMYAEGPRFPELALMVHELCAEHGWRSMARILERETAQGRLQLDDPLLAARQFYHLLIAEGVDRSLCGHPQPFTAAEIDHWRQRAVALFLHGLRGPPA